MVNSLILSTVCAIVYFIVRFLEMRFIQKESKPLKYLFRDAVFVMISVYVSYFIIDQVSQTRFDVHKGGTTPAFTDQPGF